MELKKALILILVLCFATASIFGMETVNAEPKTIVVPDDYASIQEAINAASEGDIVFVKKGTYEIPVNHTLLINKTISLIGENSENTIVNVYPKYNVTTIFTQTFYDYSTAIIIDANDCELSNLTIAPSPGGDISATGFEILIIDNNITTSLSVNGFYCNIARNNVGGDIRLKGGKP